jgi:hypothetical protein
MTDGDWRKLEQNQTNKYRLAQSNTLKRGLANRRLQPLGHLSELDLAGFFVTGRQR